MTSTPRRGRGRPRTSESPLTNDEVMLAALRAFADRGYDGMSVRELSQQLGVSHNLLNQRYGRKDQLWRAVVDHYFAPMNEEINRFVASAEAGSSDPMETFRAAIVSFVTTNAARPELLRLMNMESSIAGERIDYLFDRYISQGAGDLGRLYLSLVRDGQARSLPPETLYFVLAHGATAPAAHVPLAAKLGVEDAAGPEGIRRHAEAFADLFLDGIRVRAETTDGSAPPRPGRPSR